jgi:hypothetical protein
MTERGEGNNYGYSLWEVQAFRGADNVALIGTAKASSSQVLSFIGCSQEQCAIDNDMTTRWGSDWEKYDGAPQWFEITLSTPALIDRIELEWETAYAKAYCVTVE